MPSTLLESCWNVLRLLAEAVNTYSEPIEFCSLSLGTREDVKFNDMVDGDGCISVTLIIDPQSPRLPGHAGRQDACFSMQGLTHMNELASGSLPAEVRHVIVAYAPYCFAALYARRWQRAFAVSHFAQSLDGRIATASGHSHGIGGPENLTHAHRMRALCDGILVGAKTLQRDKPQLTVRHVPGVNPTRIIIASSLQYIDSLIQASPDPVLLLSGQKLSPRAGVDVVTLRTNDGHLSSLQILQALYQRGIYSVYIEGGSITTSRFLQEGYLDVVQIHISPIIIGSGKSDFCLPEIQQIPESLRFASHIYMPVDDGTMFVGSLCRSAC